MLHLGNYSSVLGHVCADLIITSPPYNIGSKGGPRLDGQRKYGLFDSKSFGAISEYPDNLPEDVYQKEQVEFLVWCSNHMTRNGVLVYNHKPRRQNSAMILPATWFLRPEVTLQLTLMEEVIWDRGSTHNHSNKMMWPTTERLYVFRQTNGYYPLNNIEPLSQRSDVWRINRERNSNHNAPFPLELACAAIRVWSAPGDLVCDPYAGSGTVGVAARQTGRRFEGAEVLSKYYDQAVKRIGHGI
jgi:DNA modification methylase